MLNALAQMHKETADKRWTEICSLHQEIGGLSYDRQKLQAEVLRLQKEVNRLSTENRDLKWKIEDLTADE